MEESLTRAGVVVLREGLVGVLTAVGAGGVGLHVPDPLGAVITTRRASQVAEGAEHRDRHTLHYTPQTPGFIYTGPAGRVSGHSPN